MGRNGVAGFLVVALLVATQPVHGASGERPHNLSGSAAAAVAEALFASSATAAATERALDDRLIDQQKQIAVLKAQGLVRAVQLTAAQRKFVADLAAQDHAYAQEIAVFRNAIEDIASTSEGEIALRRFNQGDEVGALTVFDQLQAARAKARQVRADMETAVEKRRIATLALEARARGKLDTNAVIARYVDVTRLDPGVPQDWLALCRLYQDAGRSTEAKAVAQTALKLVPSESDRAALLTERGNIQQVTGDLAGARASYSESLEIHRRIAAAELNSAKSKRGIKIALDFLGDVQAAQGDVAGARTSYNESVLIARGMAALDPGSLEVQHAVSGSLQRLGDLDQVQGDLSGARANYEESIVLARRIAAADPHSNEAQRDLAVDLDYLGDAELAQSKLTSARTTYQEELDIFRRLAAADPSSAKAQRDVSVSVSKIGRVQMMGGDAAGALTSLRQSLAIDRRLATADAASADIQRDLAVDLEDIGKAQMMRGDVTNALTSFQDSLEDYRRLSASDPSSAEALQDLGEILEKLGDAEAAKQDLTSARTHYRESLSSFRKVAVSEPSSAEIALGIAVAMLALAKTKDRTITWMQVVAQFENMQRSGMLAPQDTHYLDEARHNAQAGTGK